LQRVQILALSPEGKIPHWRLGFFRFLGVGLYLDINLLYFLPIVDFFPQIAQILGMVLLNIEYIQDCNLFSLIWQESYAPVLPAGENGGGKEKRERGRKEENLKNNLLTNSFFLIV